MDKLDEIHTTVKSIDLAIKGDPERGVTGITQHLVHIRKKISDHEDEDEQKFTDHHTRLIQLEQDKTFRKGAFWVVTALVVLMNMLIAIFFH